MGRIAFTTIRKTVSVGGRDFTVSALPCGVVRYHLWPLSDDLAQGRRSIDQALDDMLEHILASLAGAHPDLTKEDLLDGLLLSDLADLFREVGRVSGMRRSDAETPEGEASSPKSSGAGSTGS